MDTITYDWPDKIPMNDKNIILEVTAHVRTDMIMTVDNIRKFAIVPKYGSSYPYGKNLFLYDMDYTPITGNYWQFKLKYANKHKITEKNEIDSPWLKRPEIRYNPDPVMIVAYKYYENDAATIPKKVILNSAGSFFNDPAVIQRMRRKIEMTWWVRKFNDEWIDNFWNTINLKSMVFDGKTYQPKTLWLTHLNSNTIYTPHGVECIELEAEIIHDNEGFNYKVVQAGFNALDSDGKYRQVRIDDEGNYTLDKDKGIPVTEPVLLNKDGRLLSKSAIEMMKMTPFYTDMRYLPLADWNSLAIPKMKANLKFMGMK
jgi:hypothetical protein